MFPYKKCSSILYYSSTLGALVMLIIFIAFTLNDANDTRKILDKITKNSSPVDPSYLDIGYSVDVPSVNTISHLEDLQIRKKKSFVAEEKQKSPKKRGLGEERNCLKSASDYYKIYDVGFYYSIIKSLATLPDSQANMFKSYCFQSNSTANMCAYFLSETIFSLKFNPYFDDFNSSPNLSNILTYIPYIAINNASMTNIINEPSRCKKGLLVTDYLLNATELIIGPLIFEETLEGLRNLVFDNPGDPTDICESVSSTNTYFPASPQEQSNKRYSSCLQYYYQKNLQETYAICATDLVFSTFIVQTEQAVDCKFDISDFKDITLPTD